MTTSLRTTASFTLERCKTRAGYSARLPRELRLNLKAVADRFKVVLETPILLVLDTTEGELIVHGYGELLFKKSKNVTAMKEIAAEIYDLGLTVP